MRILYCAIDQQVPGTKGGSIHVRAVAEGLAALGHEVHVAAQPGPEGFPRDANEGVARTSTRAAGVRWHAIGAPFGRPNLRLAQMGRVKSLARTVKPDVLIERYHNFGGEGLLAARDVQAPAMLEVNAPIVDYPGSPKRTLDRLLLIEPMRRWRDWQCRAAARIVSPSRAILPAWLPADRAIEAEWGADTELFRPRPRANHANGESMPREGSRAESSDGRVTVVFAGAFRSWHGVQHLVRAMRQLHERGRTDIRAVLIGDGPELPAAREMARGLDASAPAGAAPPPITFTGALPHAQVAEQLAAADIGVAPFDLAAHAPLSLAFYWSPLKVFEYLASGLPVVAPDIPRLRDIIAPGTAGLLYDPQDPDALASTLATLADDAALRASLGAAARERAVRLFSWTSHCRLLDAALRAMVDEATGGAAAPPHRGGGGREANAARESNARREAGARPSGDGDVPETTAGHESGAARKADARGEAGTRRDADAAPGAGQAGAR